MKGEGIRAKGGKSKKELYKNCSISPFSLRLSPLTGRNSIV